MKNCKMGNFHLSEFTESPTAARLGIDNTPPQEVVENIWRLVEHILQPVRDHFNSLRTFGEPEIPLIVTSGYRSSELNAALGGVGTSQHLRGQAADFQMPGIPLLSIATFIRYSGIPFDQLILEDPPHGWIHVSYSDQRRKEVLTKRPGEPYLAGLPGQTYDELAEA